MKHNPRLNEKLARLPGFADLHPLQPESTVQGALELIDTLAHWLKTLTGMPAVAHVARRPGAHGELCGIMAIRAALEARGDKRSRILVPESAHGTNPATAAACGYRRRADPGRHDAAGSISPRSKAKLGPDVAALMLTNPNTCGLFETRDHRDRRGGARGGRLLLLRRRQFQRDRRARAAGRSRHRRACTSTCTRPSRRRMAAAGRAAARSCCRPSWRRTRRCRGSCMGRTGSA